MRIRSLFYSLSLVMALTIVLALPFPASAAKPPNVNVQILALNDFHGALNPSGGTGRCSLPCDLRKESFS